MAAPSTGRALRGSPATTRLRLLECSECGCKVRLARVWLVRAYELGRRPSCPVCGTEASCPDVLDAALYDETAQGALRDLVYDQRRGRFELDTYGDLKTWEFETRSENSSKAAKGRHRCEFRYPSGKTCSHWPKKGKHYCDTHADQETPF